MTAAKKLFAVGAVLLILGIAAFLLQPGAPERECAPSGGATSGYYDEGKQCAISQESMREWGDYYSSPKVFRIAGVVLVVAAVGVGVTAAVKSSKERKPSGSSRA